MLQGKLYTCPEYYLLVYPNAQQSHLRLGVACGSEQSKEYAFAIAKSWSNYLKYKVHIICPDDIFMCLQTNKGNVQILCGDYIGWVAAPPTSLHIIPAVATKGKNQ